MAKYSLKTQRATLSATLAVGGLQAPAASMRRIKLYSLLVGCEDTPANAANYWELQRTTTAGTWTNARTPQALDPGDTVAPSAVGQDTATANPTATANAFPLSFPLNMQATFTWFAPPGGEIIIPATANAGLMLWTSVAPNAVKGSAHWHLEEQ